jgi:prepilin-type N-terminal cleavage/methylation domain-containing protein
MPRATLKLGRLGQSMLAELFKKQPLPVPLVIVPPVPPHIRAQLRPRKRRRGFTLVELLVVIAIIALVSAVALPVVLPALRHRQVSESARIMQSVLAGARDAALHSGTPSGIRLLPDPAFPLVYMANGQVDPSQPLAANRVIPIEVAPEYTEGALAVVIPGTNDVFNVPYPAANGGGNYPFANNSSSAANVLMVKEVVLYTENGQTTPNSPTSWFWNVRVGDKLQINGSGLWYTVVGPMTVTPQQGNAEMFVNVGAAGTQSTLNDTQSGVTVHPEFLLLVNGRDDNGNGWIDEGYDGVDNDAAREAAANVTPATDDLAEWEPEAWPASFNSSAPANVAYVIQRRPAPVQNAREVTLPTNVVIDLTTWSTTRSRSRLPVNASTGYVDILVYPNGSVVPTTQFSSPASVGMDGAFLHFWIAERSDVGLVTPAGEYAVVSVVARTGRVTSASMPPIGDPFSAIQQGAR